MRIALAALIAGCATTSALAGAWTLEQGETNTYITSSFTYGDHGFDGSGNLVAVPEYQKLTLSAALEYGLRPWLTAVVRGEMTDEQIEREITPTLIAPEPQTFASVAGGARIRLFQGPLWVASTEITAFSGGYSTAGDEKPNDGPALEVRALAGYGTTIMDKPVFADAQVAYRARFEAEAPDELKVDLTLGAQVLPNWMILAQTFSTFEIGGDVSYHKVSGSVVRQVTDNLRVAVGAGATVAGRNAIAEVGGHIGFWYELPKEKPISEREARLEAQFRELQGYRSIFK
ncbi:hypothetical protein [Acuticoccus sp. I52.16.1]|uniref:hypothetical protein n=1 Tax=Acuticoccus sp. I52.16.1 TaxID=2928472 RepID=UPI001FD061EF|nr:hypothetical protein [Acuticoccus sp. I52.16.1]UOM36316.1 hypothetical protein MRB58_09045 [Acuticoccus sp. I52.16.1]